MANTFFTADLHLGHTKVIQYDNRPFLTVWDMWTTIRDNWNATVTNSDIVYNLGDTAFGSPGFTYELIKQLNGYKVLIRGNHDGSMERAKKLGFDDVQDSMTINGHIFLVHNPHHHRLIHTLVQTDDNIDTVLHGHIHTKGWIKRVDGNRTFFNMGCMHWNYTPVNLLDIH